MDTDELKVRRFRTKGLHPLIEYCRMALLECS